VSLILTVKLQVLEFPLASVAIKLLVVTPAGKVAPLGNASDLDERSAGTVVDGCHGVSHIAARTLAGIAQEHEVARTGDCRRLDVVCTVTRNEAFRPSVLVQVTVLVPFGKNDPLGGVADDRGAVAGGGRRKGHYRSALAGIVCWR